MGERKPSQRSRNDALRVEIGAGTGACSVELGVDYFDLVRTPLGSIPNAKRWASAKGVAYAHIRTRAKTRGVRGGGAVIVRASDVAGLEIFHHEIAPRGPLIAAVADPQRVYAFPASKGVSVPEVPRG